MPFDGIQTPSLSYKESLDLIGGLSTPSKMPWFGWSTSAKACKVGSKLRDVENSVCDSCYAMRGYYNMTVVRNALAKRLDAIDDPRFVDAFVTVLKHKFQTAKLRANGKKENRFRWHDSGDIQSEAHLKQIVRIAELCPEIQFYLPTKEYGIVKRFTGVFPKNLHVKLSHPMIGKKFSTLPKGVKQATVGVDTDKKLFQCPALKYQGNQCLECNKCWTQADINYPAH